MLHPNMLEPGTPRKYFLAMKGKSYLGTKGWLRQDLRALHNPGKQAIVVLDCMSHRANQQRLQGLKGEFHGWCNTSSDYDNYDYMDLFNATFSLAPTGKQEMTHRFAEILAAGSIPVMIIPARYVYVPPFEPLICWDDCIVIFHVDSLAGEQYIYPKERPWPHFLWNKLQSLSPQEIESRQRSCKSIYLQHLSSPLRQTIALREVILLRMQGIFTACLSH
jgi:hypothetical protein